jgi:hypothetical protein
MQTGNAFELGSSAGPVEDFYRSDCKGDKQFKLSADR